MLKLAHWFKNIEESGFKSFSTLRNTITHHYNDILNYFEARSTNASAESFNAKIKNFRLQLRGVKDRAFFLFRIAKLFSQSPTFVLDPKTSTYISTLKNKTLQINDLQGFWRRVRENHSLFKSLYLSTFSEIRFQLLTE